ncbi:MAG: hypothetical protein KDJ24_19725 [Gammaproteobacteria bacterium]|nr:hypothetical protein [Gammaproteobacteria bacterium]
MAKKNIFNLPSREGYEQYLSTHKKANARISDGWQPRTAEPGEPSVAFGGVDAVGNHSLVMLERELVTEEKETEQGAEQSGDEGGAA